MVGSLHLQFMRGRACITREDFEINPVLASVRVIQPGMKSNNFKRRAISYPPTAPDAAVQRHATCRRDWPGGDYDGTRTRDLRSDNPIFFSTELRSHIKKNSR